MTDTLNFAPALPEIILAVSAMLLLMVGVFRESGAFRRVSGLSLIVIAGLIAFMLVNAKAARETAFADMFVADGFALFLKVMILAGGFASMLLANRFMRQFKLNRFEFPVLMLFATVGMMVMVSANSFMTLYVGLELQSLALYVLAAFNRDRSRSTEAGLKYFVLGALSSGMLLYGISLIYGFSGTVNFDILTDSVKDAETLHVGILIGLMFVMAGLAFKISAVPFHMWAPDVYEGAPTPITAFFAAAPKVAALGLFVRVLFGAFPDAVHDWQQVIIFMSVASMLVGSFVALVQTNVKRLLAYSSIGHVGYALVGLAAGTHAGVEAILVYLAIYMTMTLGTFGVVLTMKRSGVMVEDIKDLAGLSTTNLPMAIAMAMFMFSLAGIPLLAGFFGKWFVFKAAVEAGLWPLAIIGVVTSVVGAYYYLRLVKIMFFDQPESAFDANVSTGVKLVVYSTAILNSPVSYVAFIAPLTVAASWAANSLLF